MSNAQWPNFKDTKGNSYSVMEITFNEGYPNIMCEIMVEPDNGDSSMAFEYFCIYSDGRFLHDEDIYIPEKSAFYNAVMSMFNLED